MNNQKVPRSIYLDNNSTTIIDPQVLEAMMFDFGDIPRNPSSIHSFGREARNELIRAVRAIADVFKVSPETLYFSSGATESNNFLLKGFFKKIFPKTVITSEIEHSSVFKLIQSYEESGGKVIYLPVDETGAPKMENLLAAIDSETALLTFMAVNNETGVKLDYKAIAKVAHERRIPFVIDGVALLGKEPFQMVPGITGMSFSGHKLHAPKGTGLTYLSEDVELEPLILGGNQQRGMRGGTYNLAGVLGLSKAIEMLPDILPEKTHAMAELRDHFEQLLQSQLKDVLINGSSERICNTSNLSFMGCDGESLLMNLDLAGLAASHGSACSSGSLAPSRILTAMGLSRERVDGSIRFSISRFTTKKDIERAAEIITDVVSKMRKI